MIEPRNGAYDSSWDPMTLPSSSRGTRLNLPARANIGNPARARSTHGRVLPKLMRSELIRNIAVRARHSLFTFDLNSAFFHVSVHSKLLSRRKGRV